MDIHSRVAALDGKTIKYTQRTGDGFLVESTYVDHGTKHIICFSSQIGCAIGCRFCASGQRTEQKRFRQSLSAAEMVSECENIVLDRCLAEDGRPILFSCMGEGEPLLNFEAVVGVFSQLGETYPHARGALSTSGIFPERIRGLAHRQFLMPMKLQISLHAPTDELRALLIPTTEPLAEIISAATYYARKTGNPVEWNYVLLGGVNDQESHAEALAQLFPRGAHMKLNHFNALAELPFADSSAEATMRFMAILEREGLIAETYQTNGGDVGAACGQLTYKIDARTLLRHTAA